MSDNHRHSDHAEKKSAGQYNKKSAWRSAAGNSRKGGPQRSAPNGRGHFWSSDEDGRSEQKRGNRYGNKDNRRFERDSRDSNRDSSGAGRFANKRRGNWRDNDSSRGSWGDSKESRGSWQRNRGRNGDNFSERSEYNKNSRGNWRDNDNSRRNWRDSKDSRGYQNKYQKEGSFSRRDGSYQNSRFANTEDNYRAERRNERDNPRRRLLAEIPESITPETLDKRTRKHLRSLTPDNADIVARHLAYAGEMLDLDPEVAYQHTKIAFQRAARIDVVREALGLAAYATGRYGEALKELRTYRRMSDDYEHVAMEADAERGLGRAEKALRFISNIPLQKLDMVAKIELAIVTSGARGDLGDAAGGLSVLEKIIVENLPAELAARVQSVKADRLEELGRLEEAQELRKEYLPILQGENADTDYLFDLDEILDDEAFVDAELADEELVPPELQADLAAEAEIDTEVEAEAEAETDTNVEAEVDTEPEVVVETDTEVTIEVADSVDSVDSADAADSADTDKELEE
ncbi:hypothetical protein [Arcanobacterium urinimassiliense]|uniref:hypothetical protein n=1 Tax=Arcanobacterium urinimassiliense TaxID=1871014 RepID=UPI00093A6E41|nr:hypothetical protein [Arcanobacterium urinimassiliense]